MGCIIRILSIAYIVWMETIRRKDVYVLLILLGTLLVLLTSLPIFGLGGVVQYLTDIGLLSSWLFSVILVIAVSCRQLPQEETRGTIFSLLAKPVTHFEVILGKWFGSWGIVSVATITFYLLVVLIVKAKGGNIYPVIWLQGFILHSFALGIIASLSIALSARLNYDAASTLAYIISTVSILLLPRIPELSATERGLTADLWLVLYNILPHFEIFDLRRGIAHDFPSVTNKWILLCVGYGAFWIVVFLYLAWIAYRHKPFSRVNVE